MMPLPKLYLNYYNNVTQIGVGKQSFSTTQIHMNSFFNFLKKILKFHKTNYILAEINALEKDYIFLPPSTSIKLFARVREHFI